ncbi:leucyl aminopeptidase family protein [Paenibacillus guangzhouensis]|uniref:leucyl aminopeptidase family protein n=1 Tax=Paenibacillus guangzhouensis TaxID=1473112 RepID=UPI001266C8DF|nr:leucyl aminopeptidase family protein [Paenibacillus guangzhouensis]
MTGIIGRSEDAKVLILPISKEDVANGCVSVGVGSVSLSLRPSAGDPDSLTWVSGPPGGPSMLFVGLGERARVNAECIRKAAGHAGRALIRDQLAAVQVSFEWLAVMPLKACEAAGAWMEGWTLGTYAFERYKATVKERVVPPVYLDIEGTFEAEEQVRLARIRAEGTMLARDLANEPPNALRPETFARRVQKHFADTLVRVEVLPASSLELQGMVGVLAVGRGSVHPPVMIKLTYCTDPAQPLIALVGKGITFDTGGISLKKDYNISDMRMDMAGGAAVVGAMEILSRSDASVNVVALIPAAENMPGGNALMPGEILTYANGLTVQVGNTDAEGRLVLADALLYAHRLGAAEVTDIATLTYSCTGALGSKYAGVFGDQHLVDAIREAGERVGEKVWQLPLAEEYDRYLDSDCADLCNVSSVPEAGAITAALFLRRFVHPSMKWVHLDMAGLKEVSSAAGYHAPGATGYGTRMLAEWVMRRATLHAGRRRCDEDDCD